MAMRTDPRGGGPTTVEPGTSRPLAAALWIAGGALWLGSGLIDGGSVEVLWILADLVLLAALVRLRQEGSGVMWRRSLAASIGLGIAVAGRLIFIAAEVLAAANGQDDNLLLPLGALATAVGLVVFGTAAIRSGRWPGVGRWAPLAMGVYPFVVMFPIVAATGSPSALAIALWGVPGMLVGVGLAIDRQPGVVAV